MQPPLSVDFATSLHLRHWRILGKWPRRRLKLFQFQLHLCVRYYGLMYMLCGAECLIKILKDSGKHYVCSGDSQSELRLTGIVSHKIPRKREDFPQGAGCIATFLHRPSAVPAEQDAGKPSLRDTSYKFQRRHNRICLRQSTAWRVSASCLIISNILCYHLANTSVYVNRIASFKS